jgi:2-polyprenyl-6-methoxyphenol hydroxylase-like FAD-dependent oxidoreductase
MNKSQQNYDIAVVGAGMVGAALALGLAQQGWSVALLEQHPLAAETVLPCIPELRVSAINSASVRLLMQLGGVAGGGKIALSSLPAGGKPGRSQVVMWYLTQLPWRCLSWDLW